MLPLALSYDHRVADGANAARFIVDLVKALETFDEGGVRA
jgi:pyruvate/2-oxoglutarate dehydrogenase complex dihydrolipoamide acyltransferase (E2) component